MATVTASVSLATACDPEDGQVDGPYAHLVLNSEPVAYWRLGESEGDKAFDRTGAGRHAAIEPPVAHSAEGPQGVGLRGLDTANRCLRLSGGRLTANLPSLGDEYAVEMWFCAEPPSNTRPVTGCLFTRGFRDAPDVPCDSVGFFGASDGEPGLIGFRGGGPAATSHRGGPVIEPKTWHCLVFVRRGKQVQLFLDGATKPIVDAEAAVTCPASGARFHFGGRDDGAVRFDGMIDEIAVYDRALSPGEVRMHHLQSYYPHTPLLADFRKMEEALPQRATVKPKKSRKLLILDRANGFYHPTIPLANRAIERMGERIGVFQTAIDHGYAMLTPERLAPFDAIVLNNTSNWRISDGQKEALIGFVRGGGGLMAIHGATWNFADWPEGQEMIGGRLAGHPWHDGGTWAVKIDEPDHPLCRAFGGQGFWIHDEIYMFTVFSRERSRVLLSLDMTKEANQVPGRREDNDHAISWIHEHGKGRVFHCSLGNNVAPFHAPQVLQHHLDGIQWILGDLPADATPGAKLATQPQPALAPERP
jgi:type 1 glutamine amidotransferase